MDTIIGLTTLKTESGSVPRSMYEAFTLRQKLTDISCACYGQEDFEGGETHFSVDELHQLEDLCDKGITILDSKLQRLFEQL